MAGRYVRPSYQYFDNSGRVLDLGQLFFYDSGTTTLKDVYSDPDGLTPIANPVELNGAGRTPDIYLEGSYKLIIKDKNGVQIEERDPILAADDTTKGFAAWNAVTTYSENDIVRASNDLLYISIANSNQNNEPSASAAQWTRVQLLGSYNANQTYSIGEVVIDSIGDIYRSLTNSNTGNTPASSGSDWTTVVAGAFSGNVTVGGTLGATGATTLYSTLAVTGTSTLSGSILIPNNIQIQMAESGGTLRRILGMGSDDKLRVNLDGTGETLLYSGGSIALTLDASQDATFSGDATVSGILAVTGVSTFTGAVVVNDTTQSTSTTTGSIQTDGGLGVVKDAYFGGTMDVNGVLTGGAVHTDGSIGFLNFGTPGGALGTDTAILYIWEGGAPYTKGDLMMNVNVGGSTSIIKIADYV